MMLDDDEREIQRARLFRMVGNLAGNSGADSATYAIAFVLWDAVGQLVDIKQALREINETLHDIGRNFPE
jgi:hypothetical protein